MTSRLQNHDTIIYTTNRASTYLDLLFYHLKLRRYVVIELKTGEFKPEYAGQPNFYLSAVDGILKAEGDNPSIGLLLCKTKNDLVAEYSLKDVSKPIGVSEYRVTGVLPEELRDKLLSVEDIQNRIGLGEKFPAVFGSRFQKLNSGTMASCSAKIAETI